MRYTVEPCLDMAEFIDILTRSGLAERRPVNDLECMKTMVRNANLIVSARTEGGQLVGVSRALTDHACCCYLADLAVDVAFQGQGIGRELIRQTREAAGGDVVTLLLLSAPAAMNYYPKVGLARLENCFGVLRANPGPGSNEPAGGAEPDNLP